MNKFLLGGNELHFTENDLPILIHGIEHVGSSQFTISLLADLYTQGSKILFFTGYQMAKDEFIKQVGEPQDNRVIFVKGTEPSEFIQNVKELEDISERVILIINVELFDQSIFDAVFEKNKLVVSGDIEKVPYKERLLSKKFNTKILFSPASFEQIPEIQQWSGYLIGEEKRGEVSLLI
mgnify:CR=1 FL=1|jgi:hypothetical protein